MSCSLAFLDSLASRGRDRGWHSLSRHEARVGKLSLTRSRTCSRSPRAGGQLQPGGCRAHDFSPVLATWGIRSKKSRTSKSLLPVCQSISLPLLNGEAEKCSGKQGERQQLLLLHGRGPGERRQTDTGILRELSSFV